jgi:GAF domain-containing protein
MSVTPDSNLADPQQIIADLQCQLGECRAELDKAQRNLNETTTERDEALAREGATAEVLRVINSSPGELAPVFKAVLQSAVRICEANFGTLYLHETGAFRAVAMHNTPPAYAEARTRALLQPPPDAPLGRVAITKQVAHIADIRTNRSYVERHPFVVDAAELGNFRTVLSVPMLRDDELIGAININRQEVRPFTDKQIELVRTFADQAVIAIENARLLTETREALEQQTATAEVLQVINSSPGDLASVFSAIVEKAHSLCNAGYGSLQLWDGEKFRGVAMRGFSAAMAEGLRHGYIPGPNHPSRHLLGGERVAHCADLAEIDDPVTRAGGVALEGVRTILFVALRKDDAFLGQIVAARKEVRPFTEKEIALVENFAAQAVIAMENARLINETREALEQQTATAEVLQVINSSSGDLAPVFDTILDKAHSLCGAPLGSLVLHDGDQLRAVATRGYPHEYDVLACQGFPPTPTFRLFLTGEPFVHVLDGSEPPTASEDHPIRRAAAEIAGIRTVLFVPLRKDATVLGYISAQRQEVRPFRQKQITLLQKCAAQAVIAMENVRLLTETREALEQQTATAEVLQVINSSPGDLAPVFDAILEKAHTLCGAAHGILLTRDGDQFRVGAVHGDPGYIEGWWQLGQIQPVEGGILARLMLGERLVHLADAMAEDSYRRVPWIRGLIEAGTARTTLATPLCKDDKLLGVIFVFRNEVRAFTDKQIALLQNFAQQAVIAMENARLISETREALEQQTATAEVLQVINSSPGQLAPVFEAMLEKATRLCGGVTGVLWAINGERSHVAAALGLPAEFIALLRERGESGTNPVIKRVIDGERLIEFPDTGETEYFHSGDPIWMAAVDAGVRSLIWVALVKDGVALGAFAIGRPVVGRFSDKQIALLQNFAAQAVIAMENARLLTETREALEQQTATAEVLQVINSSPGDLTPVFDAILEKAHTLCGAEHGALATFDGEMFRAAATRGLPEAFAELLRGGFRPLPGSAPEPLLRGERCVHIVDMAALVAESTPAAARLLQLSVDLAGTRTLLLVPLRKDGALLGYIAGYRQEVRPFSDKQIALLQNFAAQAVIAMENARLLDEIRQRQQELRVTFDNMVDGVAMFDEALHLAAWNRNFQELLQLPDELLAKRPDFDTYIRYLVERGEFGATDPETQIAPLRARICDHYSFERVRPDGTVIEIRHNPMPDGGIVLIYSDITERKRSEAEIKAARDAAEAAYRDLKAAQASLIQAEKMASLGQLTAGIAHEIKNPLNFVNNFAGLSVELLDELKETAAPATSALDDDKRAEIDETINMLSGNLEKIAEHGRRADNIVTSMLEHSRGSSGERRSVDLNALIEEALNLAYHGARAQDQSFNITLERDYADTMAPIELVPQDISRVCLNLFGNGFYAATKRQKEGNDGSFKPTLKVSTRDLGEAVEIRVRDNGIGILPGIKDKLFQPFFTTKPTGEGTGLGLSISYDIVTQQHGGTISVDSQIGEFTEFTVRLPRTFGATIAEAAS